MLVKKVNEKSAKKGERSLSSYYMLVKAKDRASEVFSEADKFNLAPARLDNEDNGLIALRIMPNNLAQLDNATKHLNVRYFILTNILFTKLISLAKRMEFKIRDIKIDDDDNELKYELDRLLEQKDYENLNKFIDTNQIIVKELDFSIGNTILKVYDSGILWSDGEIQDKPKIKSLFAQVAKASD